MRCGGRLGGGDVHDDDPVQTEAFPESGEVGDERLGGRRLVAALRARWRRPDLGVGRVEFRGQHARQAARHDARVGELLGPFDQARVDDVVSAEDQVVEAGQRHAVEGFERAHTAGGRHQSGAQRGGADDGRRGHRAAGTHQPDSGTHECLLLSFPRGWGVRQLMPSGSG